MSIFIAVACFQKKVSSVSLVYLAYIYRKKHEDLFETISEVYNDSKGS